VAGAVHERDVALQPVFASAAIALAWWIDLLFALERPVAGRPRTLRVIALVYLCVRITELDGDVALEFVLETDRLDTTDGLDDSTLSVSDVSNCADVDGGLAGDDLR